jgi:lipopolysaccharide transport system ATP-binding protein
MRTPVVLEFEFWNRVPEAQLNLSVQLYNQQGVVVFNTTSFREARWDGQPFPVGLFQSRCYIPGDLLNEGTYLVELIVVRDRAEIVYHLSDVLSFDVHDIVELKGEWYGKWNGVVHPNLLWATDLLDATNMQILTPA